jgi:hypothetical protein
MDSKEEGIHKRYLVHRKWWGHHENCSTTRCTMSFIKCTSLAMRGIMPTIMVIIEVRSKGHGHAIKILHKGGSH